MHTIIIGCEGSKGMQKLVIKNVSKFLMCEASMEVALKWVFLCQWMKEIISHMSDD